jgi:hypothetical protein
MFVETKQNINKRKEKKRKEKMILIFKWVIK